MNTFGKYIRHRREELLKTDCSFTVRKVAAKVGFEPSFLSKVERGEVPPPSETKINGLAKVLGEDPDVLLALAGKVASDLLAVVVKRPKLFAQLIRHLKDMPDNDVLRLFCEVRDGKL